MIRCAAAGILSCGVLILAGCPKQTTTFDGSYSQKDGGTVSVKHEIQWDPPGSYLVSFDASQALLNLSLTNATIVSTSGTVLVSVKDLTTNTIVGQNTFGYVVRGTSIYAQDPTTVYNWLQQFTGYANIDVITDVTVDMQNISSGDASSIGNAQYQGITYASGTVSWSLAVPPPPSSCDQAICPNQN